MWIYMVIKNARTHNIMYKKLPVHRLFKGCFPQQVYCSLIGNRPQTATFHTCNVGGNLKNEQL
jgi:hypothetical protein